MTWGQRAVGTNCLPARVVDSGLLDGAVRSEVGPLPARQP